MKASRWRRLSCWSNRATGFSSFDCRCHIQLRECGSIVHLVALPMTLSHGTGQLAVYKNILLMVTVGATESGVGMKWTVRTRQLHRLQDGASLLIKVLKSKKCS